MRIFRPVKSDELAGRIVLSVCGRDQGEYCVITELDGDHAYIANGRQRRVEKPKRKKLKHLRLTDFGIPCDGVENGKTILTNRQVKILISEYHKTAVDKNDVYN